MLEALLRVLHRRWRPTLEVPVRTPARGVIDLVLYEPDANVMVAIEAQSEIRRVEQQLRWAAEKADSLPSSELWRASISGPRPMTGRLLLLRSTRATRALVTDFRATFESAYPGDHAAARRALVTPDAPWVADAILWANVDADGATVLERRPPGLRLGRSPPGQA